MVGGNSDIRENHDNNATPMPLNVSSSRYKPKPQTRVKDHSSGHAFRDVSEEI